MKKFNHNFLTFIIFLMVGVISQGQHMFYHLLPGFTPAFTWVGLGGDANWNTTANWSTGAVPAASDIAIFDDSCISNCDPTINVAINVGGVNMKNSYSGTINQDVGQAIIIGSGGWTQAGGNFVGSASNVTINGTFNFTAGNYTATSGTTTFAGNISKTGGTFTHNNGNTIIATGSGQTIVPGNIEFYDLTMSISSNVAQDLSGGTIVANRHLTLTYGAACCDGGLNNGTIQVKGDVNILNFGRNGSAVIELNGNTNQTVTGSGTAKLPGLRINSTGGTVTLSNAMQIYGAYTYTAGTVDATTSNLLFISPSAQSIIPGNVQYNDVMFSSLAAQNLNAGTMIVNGTLTLDSSAACCDNGLNNGTVSAKGNVNITNYGRNGTAKILISGASSQTITGNANAKVGDFEIASTGGTVTIANTIYFQGHFTYTSGATSLTGSTAVFMAINSTQTIKPGPIQFDNVTFTVYGTQAQTLDGGTMTVNGALTIDSTAGCCESGLDNGIINAAGNVSFTNRGRPGNVVLNFVGNTNTTLTIAGTATTLSTTHNIAKTGLATSVSLVANTSYATAGRNFMITSGTLNLAGFTFNVNSLLTVSVGGRLLCNGGTATAGTWSMLGEISCGTGQGITWTGAAGDNLWSTAGNWTNNTVPAAGDNAIFNNSACVGANCNAQVNSNLTVRGIWLQSTYPGTLTQNTTRSLTIGSGNYIQAGGTFAGGDSTLTTNGTFDLSGGTFTSTTATWTAAGNVTFSGAPTFNHNNGTFSTTSSITISANGNTFNNVTLAGASATTQNLNSQIMVVAGTLTMNSSHPTSAGTINSGTIHAQGDISSTGPGKQGSAVILINGGGAQLLSAAAAIGSVPVVTIDKAAGTLTLDGNILATGNWTWLQGTVNAGTSTLNFNSSVTVTPGSVVYNNVTFGGSASANTSLNSGSMIVAGSLNLDCTHVSTEGTISNGTIEARGDINLLGTGKAGSSATVLINGTGAQSINGLSTSEIPGVTINKASGTLTLNSVITTAGNWSWQQGTVDASTSTLQFILTSTIIPGPVVYNNVTFGGSVMNFNLSGGSMIVGGTLNLADSHVTTPGIITNGTLEARGNITLTGVGKAGSATLLINGTGAQSLIGSASGRVPAVNIDKPSGTLTLSNTIRTNSNWTWTNGTVDSGTSSVFFDASSTIIPGSIIYNNISFGGSVANFGLSSGTMIVAGTLTLADVHPTTPGQINSGLFDARGNVTVSSTGKSGNATISLSGNTNGVLTLTSGLLLTTTVTVDKTGGASVSLGANANFSTAGRDFTINSGTLDLAGYDFSTQDVLTVAVGAILKCNGGEINPAPVTITNLGTINCPGYSTYDFNWTGAGGTDDWTTAGNWQNGVAPSSTDIVVFQDTYCGGTCNSEIASAASVKGVRIYSPFTGTITQAAGQSLTVGTRGWSQNAGTFTGGDSAINNGGNFSLTGGVFTSTSGVYTLSTGNPVARIWNVGAGTFNHNNGSVVISINAAQTTTFTGGANPYYDLNFATWTGGYTVSGTTTVNNHFQFGSSGGGGTAYSGGVINALGNVTCNNFGGSTMSPATMVFNVSGTGTQNITGTANCTWPGLTINKASGTANLIGTIDIRGVFSYTTGTVNAGTSKVKLYSVTSTKTHSPNGISLNDVELSTWGTGIHNLSSQVLNVGGTLTFDATTSTGTINAGTINASGNVVHTGTTGLGGTMNLNLVGATNTTITPNGTLALPGATVTINKSSSANSVTLVAATRFNNAGQNLVVTNGVLDMAGFNLTVGNNITNSGTIQRGSNPTCGTISQGGTYSGNAAICP